MSKNAGIGMGPVPRELAVPLLALDLDGTVRHGKDELGRFVNTASDVVIFPEALAQMRAWKAKGGRIIAVSNQGGIALGHMTFEACLDTIVRTHELCESLFDKVAFCRHHPDAFDPEYARCWCRKPSPGLLIEIGAGFGSGNPRGGEPGVLSAVSRVVRWGPPRRSGVRQTRWVQVPVGARVACRGVPMISPVQQVVPGFNIPTVVFAENQPEYIPLPAWRGEDGTVVTRWRFGWKERLLLLLTGDLWLTVLTFNHPLQPVKLDTVCPIMGHPDEEA